MAPSATDPAWAWLWGDEPGSSDVTLLVYPAGDGPDAAWSDGKPEPSAKLALHAIVLASVSPGYFRPRTHGDWQPLEPAAAIGTAGLQGSKQPVAKRKPAAKHPKTGAPVPSAKVLELTCFPGEPPSVPEAAICHAYTGRLPDEPSLLARMIARADYLDMAATVEACLAKLKELSAAGQLTIPDVIAISSLPALQTDGSKAALEQAVVSMAAKVLSSHLGSTRQVLLDQQLLDQLVQLPFPLFMQWARLESLKVDSENTMAVLITAWYDHQLSSNPAAAPTVQQCKELSTLICLNKLTLPFHLQAMLHLKWFRSPGDMPEQHATMRVMILLMAGMQESYAAALASGGTVRQQQGPAKAEHRWPLSRQQLDTLCDRRGLRSDQRRVLHLEGDIYFAGFCFTAKIGLTKRVQPAGQAPSLLDEYELGFVVHAGWHSALLNHGVALHVRTPVTAASVVIKICPETVMAGTLTSGLGWIDVAQRSFSRLEELVAYMATPAGISITFSDAS